MFSLCTQLPFGKSSGAYYLIMEKRDQRSCDSCRRSETKFETWFFSWLQNLVDQQHRARRKLLAQTGFFCLWGSKLALWKFLAVRNFRVQSFSWLPWRRKMVVKWKKFKDFREDFFVRSYFQVEEKVCELWVCH